MEFLIYLILLIVGVLQVILFFKIWVMTDDVKAIKNGIKDYDPYNIYAKTFATAKAKEYLSNRPKVAEVVSLYDNDTTCSLAPEGGYEVKTVWSVLVKAESGNTERTCAVTLHLACDNSSLPMMSESWRVVSEPKATLV